MYYNQFHLGRSLPLSAPESLARLHLNNRLGGAPHSDGRAYSGPTVFIQSPMSTGRYHWAGLRSCSWKSSKANAGGAGRKYCKSGIASVRRRRGVDRRASLSARAEAFAGSAGSLFIGVSREDVRFIFSVLIGYKRAGYFVASIKNLASFSSFVIAGK